MQVLAGAGLQGDPDDPHCDGQSSNNMAGISISQNSQFLHDGTVMRNKGSAQFGQLILTDQIP